MYEESLSISLFSIIICNYIDDSRTTVVRHSRECLTTVVRISVSFIFSQLSLEMVSLFAFVSHICRIVQIAETKLRCVCEGSRRRVCDACDDSRRLFCDDLCRTKKYYMFETFANRTRPVRDACEDFAVSCERLATV